MHPGFFFYGTRSQHISLVTSHKFHSVLLIEKNNTNNIHTSSDSVYPPLCNEMFSFIDGPKYAKEFMAHKQNMTN